MTAPGGASGDMPPSTARLVAMAGGARLATLPVGLVAGLLTTNILVRHYGPDGFALYALVAFLPMLLPAADLGVGASVLDAVARREEIGPVRVADVVRRGALRLIGAAVVLSLAATALALTHVWSRLLGVVVGFSSATVDTAAAVSVCAFALAMPVSLGLRMLQGLERTHTAVVLQGLSPAVTLLLVWSGAHMNLSLALLPGAPSVALVVIAGASCLLAARPWRFEVRRLSPNELPSGDLSRGLPLSGSFFILGLALPVTFQTDRIVLAHTQGLGAVAAYSAGSQLWAPCVGLIAAAGASLWPAFARQRASSGGVTMRAFRRAALLFTLGGVGLAAPLTLLGPTLTELSTSGRASAGYGLMLAFGGLLVVNAVQYPAGMYLMDPRGARFQATCAVIMASLNLPLAIYLSRVVGVAGTVLATCILFPIVMSAPAYWRAHKQLEAPRPPKPGRELLNRAR